MGEKIKIASMRRLFEKGEISEADIRSRTEAGKLTAEEYRTITGQIYSGAEAAEEIRQIEEEKEGGGENDGERII